MSDLIVGLLAIILGQIIGWCLSSIVFRAWTARRVYTRLRSERLFAVGIVLAEVRDSSGGPPLIGQCVVTKFEKQPFSPVRVEVRNLVGKDTLGGKAMSWSGLEMENLHPVTEVDTNGHPYRLTL